LVFSDVSEQTGCPEASVTSYQSTLRNIPEEERRPESGNLKYREKVLSQIPNGPPWDRIRFLEENFKMLGPGGQEYSGEGKYSSYAKSNA
jgi:hypothetical protein